jgi:hypothetical protein
MNFQQWKLKREIEEQTECESFRKKTGNATDLWIFFFGIMFMIIGLSLIFLNTIPDQ